MAYGFYARCHSIMDATDAAYGRIHCPACEAIVLRAGNDRAQELVCAACGWRVTWGAYQETYRRKQLTGGGATPFFREYMERLGQTRTPGERMLLIDWMVHQCHESVQRGAKTTLCSRPAAVNLIDGTMSQVMALLEGLAANASTAEMQQHRELWRERVLSGFGGRERWLEEHGKGNAQQQDAS